MASGSVCGNLISGGDLYDSGGYHVAGTVGVYPNVLGRYEVRLQCAISGRAVRTQWSDAAGNYDFKHVRRGPWIVLVRDYTGSYEPTAIERFGVAE